MAINKCVAEIQMLFKAVVGGHSSQVRLPSLIVGTRSNLSFTCATHPFSRLVINVSFRNQTLLAFANSSY